MIPETRWTAVENVAFFSKGSIAITLPVKHRKLCFIQLTLVSICSFFALCCSFCFFIAWFGFSTMMLVLVFCCSFRCSFLLLLVFMALDVSHPPAESGQESVVRMNEAGNEKCSLLLDRFGFGGVFRLPFVAFCCSSSLAFVFQFSKSKTGKCLWLLLSAFCCSFWFFIDVSI